MLYFREEEKRVLHQFAESATDIAMAVYGRRRTGKTCLMMDFYNSFSEMNPCVYYQCTSLDYGSCLKDFIEVLKPMIPETTLLERMLSFREVFQYLSQIGIKGKIFILDEFPFLAKKSDNVAVEFQWIIDHGLGGNKLILLGSSLSFMKRQIGDREAPLYGRFNKVLELQPFSFQEVYQLFPHFEDAVAVYARTGGVAQYVMLYHRFESVEVGDRELFFHPNGSLFQEADNLLMQELREVSTYAGVLRAIGSGEKESGQIASRCGLDARAVFTYLNKLMDLNIVSLAENPLVEKKRNARYIISDFLYRFHFTFIEPRISMITTLREKAMPYILNHQYDEYLGFVYESIIRGQCYYYGLDGTLPFMPLSVGKWWGNIQECGEWKESEVDVIAYDERRLVAGECKYRTKAAGVEELERLKLKAQFLPTKGRELFYLIASKSGFTEELQKFRDPHVILIDQV
jgi:AAA+ ATPase superfamily predicted ATPase